MKKILLALLLPLLMMGSLYSQWNSINAHVVSYVPFTPCVGSPISFSAIDTTGQFTLATHYWNFGDGSNGYGNTQNPAVSHVYASPGTYMVHLTVYDSLQFNFYERDSFLITVDSICGNHDNISGVTYFDVNGNGVQNFGEPVLPNRLIEVTPGPYYITSDANGYYAVNMIPGTYNFSLLPPMYMSVSQPGTGSYTVTSAGNGSLHPGNDFGLAPIPGINDLRVTYTSLPPVPGFNRYFYVNCQNVGTTMQNATVTLQYDPQLNFISAANGGTNAGNTITWSLPNMLPGTSAQVSALLYVPLSVVVGGSLNHIATINPIPGDTTPNNNTDSHENVVVASYDPNDKAVLPKGLNASGDIAPLTPLRYKIRFQNTGTYLATNVIIRDTLDVELDQTTLEVLGASHPFIWHNDFGKLAFEFHNIMLPDSNSNEPGSHGFVEFRITPKANLPLGTELTNTGHIYFDFNAPIVTNTTLNTLANLTSVSPSHNLIGLTVAPNPFGSYTQFEFNNSAQESFDLVVRDLSGRTVQIERGINGNSFQLDASSLPAGMYLYTLKGAAGNVASGKLIKQ